VRDRTEQRDRQQAVRYKENDDHRERPVCVTKDWSRMIAAEELGVSLDSALC